MHELIISDAFRIYAVCRAILGTLMFVLGSITAARRGMHKNPATPEDARDGNFSEKLAPEVDRARRTHNNAAEHVPIMALTGLVYVLAGASPACVGALMGVVTVARIGHAVCYLMGVQPWRSAMHIACNVATLGMLGHTVKLVFAP